MTGRPQRDAYERRGLELKAAILAALPSDWSFEGKRVLDFGCGAGRILRHFRDEASTAQIWGCDIHEPSIRWIKGHLSLPIHVFRNQPAPPLPVADGSFDLIWAVSVLTHISHSWSSWLLDLHRVLRPDGLLLATFMGEGVAEGVAGEAWVEARVGMNVWPPTSRYVGGPVVQHSPWWIRAHWGRAFHIVQLEGAGFAADAGLGQGWALLQKKPVALTEEDLERWDEQDPRELAALRHNVRQLERQMADVLVTRSWRWTAPLRRAHGFLQSVTDRRPRR